MDSNYFLGYSTHVGMTISTDLWNAAVHLYKHHVKSLRRVVALLGNNFSKSALHKWLGSHPATKKRLPAPRKVTAEVETFIDTYLGANPFATAQGLVQAVRQHLSVALGRSTMRRAIKRLGFTQKRTYARAPDTDKIVSARGAFCAATQTMHPDSL